MFNMRALMLSSLAMRAMSLPRFFLPPIPKIFQPSPRYKPRRRRFYGRTQELIADRSSNISKLQRSPISLMESDERARKRHIHPRSKRQ